MIDLAFAALLATIGMGLGRRLLDRLGQAPEHPVDASALAMPMGLGLLALGVLGLGALGRLDRIGLSALLAVAAWLGLGPALRMLRGFLRRDEPDPPGAWASRILAVLLSFGLIGTAMVATSPVTDGDCALLSSPGSQGLPDVGRGRIRARPARDGLSADDRAALRRRAGVPRSDHLPLDRLVPGPVAVRERDGDGAGPALGRRAWWAGAVVLLVPAITNGMSAPLNDVPLAAFGASAIYAWTLLLDRPGARAAIVAGLMSGLALGVKYPALVLVGLLGGFLGLLALRCPAWRRLAAIYALTAIAAGGCWYLRAYVHTGNPVHPFFRHVFGGAGLDEVLDPIKRPMAVTPWNLLTAIVPLTLRPDRFDSFSHQFGPVFLLFLPWALLERPRRRVLGLSALGYLFLMLCLTQRQSMRFVLIAMGPMSVAIAWGLNAWCDRRTLASRCLSALLLLTLGFESALAMSRARHVAGLLAGRESADAWLARREPTYLVGAWAADHLPASSRVIGQDHRGFYIPRPYTMELAHRRRTGLGRRGERPERIVDRLRSEGFTHLLLCPPLPETAVEFDPTLGRLLAPWLAVLKPIYRRDLTDGDGVLRRYAIYDLYDDRLASRPEGGARR